MKQAMVIMAIFLIALGFVFIVMGYAMREGPITPDGNGNGNGEDGYPPEYTPPNGTPPEGDGDGGGLPSFPPWEEPSKPMSTFKLFGYTVTVYELVGAIMCIVGAVIFVTGGRF